MSERRRASSGRKFVKEDEYELAGVYHENCDSFVCDQGVDFDISPLNHLREVPVYRDAAVRDPIKLKGPSELNFFEGIKTDHFDETGNQPRERLSKSIPVAFHHIKTKGNIREIIRDLESVFDKLHIDAEMDKKTYSWDCFTYPAETPLNFFIYISSSGKANSREYLFEFVRNKGDAMSFHSIFEAIKKLVGNHLVQEINDYSTDDSIALSGSFGDSWASPNMSRSSSFADEFDLDLDPSDFDTTSVLEPYIPLIESPIYECFTEGIEGLAREMKRLHKLESSDTTNRVFDVVVKHLEQPWCHETEYACLQIMLTYAGSDHLCTSLVSPNVLQLLLRIATKTFVRTHFEAQRIAGVILLRLCEAGHSDAVSTSITPLTDKIATLQAYNDSRYNETVTAIRKRIAN